MNNVVEIAIGIDHNGNADMFDTETDTDPEKKTFQVRSRLKLMTLTPMLRKKDSNWWRPLVSSVDADRGTAQRFPIKRRCFLKRILKILIICCFIAFLSSCGKNDSIYKGVAQGMYEGANQAQEMKRDDPVAEPGNEPASYDQYERDRQETMKDKSK